MTEGAKGERQDIREERKGEKGGRKVGRGKKEGISEQRETRETEGKGDERRAIIEEENMEDIGIWNSSQQIGLRSGCQV